MLQNNISESSQESRREGYTNVEGEKAGNNLKAKSVIDKPALMGFEPLLEKLYE